MLERTVNKIITIGFYCTLGVLVGLAYYVSSNPPSILVNSPEIWQGITIGSCIFFGVLLWLKFRKYQQNREHKIYLTGVALEMAKKRRILMGNLWNAVDKSLSNMDKIGKYFRDEEEANRELATALRLQGYPVEYQHRLDNNRVVDMKVNNMLIEGKLEPDISEIDRLFGQLSAYMKTEYQVTVVIYGFLERHLIDRIRDEIYGRYQGRVFLNYLDVPMRVKSPEPVEDRKEKHERRRYQ